MAEVKLTITGQNLTKQAIDQLKRDLADTTNKLNVLNQGTARVEDTSRKARTGVLELAAGLGAISAASTLVIRSGIQAAIQFEKMKLGLTAVAGSAQAANTQMVEFRKLAKLPGLGLPEVVKAATSLQSLDMSLRTTTQVIREWGNELVRMGKGRYELDRIVLALTQMVGKGRGFGQEIRQIAEAMPSIRKHMKAAFGTTASEEFEKMGITAQKFIAGITAELAKMPRVAGGAANAMENFTDAVFNARVAFGEAFLPALTKALDIGTKLLEKYAEMPESFRAMTSQAALAFTAITALGAGIAGLVLIAEKAKLAIAALNGAITWLAVHPMVAGVAAVGAMAAALGVMIYKARVARSEVVDLGKSMADAKASFDRLSQMDRLINEIERLREKKEKTVEETKRLEQAQKDIIALEPRMLAYYDKEGKAIADTTEKMKEKVEQMREMTFQQLELNAAQARARIPELEKDIEKQTENVNKLLKAGVQYSTYVNDLRKGSKADIYLAESYQDMWTKTDAEYKKASADLEKSREELARYRADLESYDKARKGISILPLPGALERPSYKPTKEDQEAFMELQKARAEAIEDEYTRRTALAEAAFGGETAGFEGERKAIKASEASQDEKYKKLQALDAKFQAAQIRRESAIRDAEKKRAEDTAKIESERLERIREQNEKDRAFRIAANERLMEITRRQEEEAERKDKERLDRMREQNQKNVDFKIAANKRLMEITKTDEEEAARRRKEQMDWLMARLKEDQEYQKRQMADMVKAVKDAQDAIRQEAARTFDAYYLAEEMRISLINDATQRELQQARLVYETKRDLIKAELAEAQVSADRRAELERQLGYLSERYARDTAEIQKRTRDQVIRSVSDSLAAFPSGFAQSILESRGIAKRYAAEFQDLQEETAREADRINSDYTKSAAQKHRELERLEKESAQRRLEIEKRLDQERRDIYTDFVKSFFAGILRELENMLIQQKIAPKIFDLIAEQFGKAETGGAQVPGLAVVTGLATGNPWPALAAAAGPMLEGLGFDNPVNDRTARDFGKAAAMLKAASFDFPLNDLNAKLAGARTAAYSLGRRSADDMVENFTTGFIQQGGADRSKPGISDSEVTEILGDLKNALESSVKSDARLERALNNPPQMQLTIDGRELHSVIQRISDRVKSRQEGY